MRVFSELLNHNPITRCLKNARNRAINAIFQRLGAKEMQIPINGGPLNKNAICFTIAFNRPLYIEVLIEAWKEYSSDTLLVVVDNSSNQDARNQIKQICVDSSISYISLPKNIEWSVNRSHALAMNWVYYNLVKKWKPDLFGFLDHDCIPYESFNLNEIMKGTNLMGSKRVSTKNPEIWSLWAGFCFYRLKCLESIVLDFTHSVELGLDTGGANWKSLYKHVCLDETKFVPTGPVPKGELFSQMSCTIDNSFLHVGSVSYRNKKIDKNLLINALKNISKTGND